MFHDSITDLFRDPAAPAAGLTSRPLQLFSCADNENVSAYGSMAFESFQTLQGDSQSTQQAKLSIAKNLNFRIATQRSAVITCRHCKIKRCTIGDGNSSSVPLFCIIRTSRAGAAPFKRLLPASCARSVLPRILALAGAAN
jgi:hypothetical protein